MIERKSEIINRSDVAQRKFERGLCTYQNYFNLSIDQSPGCIDVDFNQDGSKSKRLGTSTMNTIALASTAGYGMFDFGIGNAPQSRRLLCAAGTGLFYSTDLGKTWTTCHTSRTASRNHFSFVKDYAVNCNDSYGVPLYWAGSTATNFITISTAAPAAKYPIAHLGYFFLLNGSNNPRYVYYVDWNEMFTNTYSSFQLPTDRNDEITGSFVLGKFLYISTRYKIFRLSYVGGNPWWDYKEVKDWGFVPETFKKINMPQVGEVVVGLDWNKRLRLFDGVDDEIISDQIEEDNGITPFYMKNINDSYISSAWAENDKKAQTYRCYVAYGTSTLISHSINLNYRVGALYPYQNTPYQSGIFAEDTDSTLHMLACGYNGRIYHVDSGNRDVTTAVNDYYISPFLFKSSPVQTHKAQQIDMFFKPTSSGTVYYEDREQYSTVWNLRKSFTLGSAVSNVQIRISADIPSTCNVYQYKLSSSANTANPWRLNLADYSHSSLGIGQP